MVASQSCPGGGIYCHGKPTGSIPYVATGRAQARPHPNRQHPHPPQPHPHRESPPAPQTSQSPAAPAPPQPALAGFRAFRLRNHLGGRGRNPGATTSRRPLRGGGSMDGTLLRFGLYLAGHRGASGGGAVGRVALRQSAPGPRRFAPPIQPAVLGFDALCRGHQHRHHVLRHRRTRQPIPDSPRPHPSLARIHHRRASRRDLDHVPLRLARLGTLCAVGDVAGLFCLPPRPGLVSAFDAAPGSGTPGRGLVGAPGGCRRNRGWNVRYRHLPGGGSGAVIRGSARGFRPAVGPSHPSGTAAGRHRAGLCFGPDRHQPRHQVSLLGQRGPGRSPGGLRLRDGPHPLPGGRHHRQHRRPSRGLPFLDPRDFRLEPPRFLAKRLDLVLLGVVDHLGGLRRAVPGQDFPWPHRAAIRSGFALHPLQLRGDLGGSHG